MFNPIEAVFFKHGEANTAIVSVTYVEQGAVVVFTRKFAESYPRETRMAFVHCKIGITNDNFAQR